MPTKLLLQKLLKEDENYKIDVTEYCLLIKNHYNISMRKLLILLIVLSVASPSHAFFWNKKDKALEKELQGKGYAGTLPDIESSRSGSQTKVAEPIFELQPDFGNPADLKPVPKDNPAFIDIIQKKDKTSQYTNDMNNIIPMLEKLCDCIEDNENLQLFISKANVVSSNIDYLIEKYDGKPESYNESFKKLTEVGRYTKTIMTLRREAVIYQKYLAYQGSGSIYNPSNIEQQLEYLKNELTAAILLLKEEG